MELAEIHHLLARLPLHAAVRPGFRELAVERALAHASDAEALYHEVGAEGQVARVWETRGRLELLRGAAAEARELLERALEAEEHAGDVVGLARTTAGLADALAALGQPLDALRLLAESVELNLRKGSPLGLAFNRRALVALRERGVPTDALDAAHEVERALAAAEGLLGRVEIPGR